jgi:hypothetical protein
MRILMGRIRAKEPDPLGSDILELVEGAGFDEIGDLSTADIELVG